MVRMKLILIIYFFFSCPKLYCQDREIFWNPIDTKIAICNCYTQGNKDLDYKSMIELVPIKINGINYNKLYISKKTKSNLKSFNYIRWANDTLYIKGGGNDTMRLITNVVEDTFFVFSKDDYNMRYIRPYTMFGRQVQFKLKEYEKNYNDYLNYYYLSFKSKSAFGDIIYYLVVSKYKGIIFYVYFDGNINHFCIQEGKKDSKNSKQIIGFLRNFKDKRLIRTFKNRKFFPRFFLQNGENIYF